MPKVERSFELERIVFFSDAVFAIALTLLVIDLPVPDLAAAATDGDFRAALGQATPNIIAFLISFWVVATYWRAHHRTFRWIVRWNSGLIMRNLLFLFFVAILPWPTKVLAELGDFPSAVALYAATMVATGLTSFELWRFVRSSDLMAAGYDDRVFRAGAMRTLAPVLVFGASIPLAYVNVSAAQYFWLTLIPLEWATGWYAHRIGAPDSGSDEALEAALAGDESAQAG